MARYRPPQPKASPYITRDGYEALQQEEKSLWQRRKHVTRAVTAAAAEGDRSENAEYIYRKKELREIDRRIRYLQKRLPDLKIVDTIPDNPHQIFFGAWVTLQDEEEKNHCFRIVGPDEFDSKDEYISMDSPMARALIKKELEDEVVVQTPKGAIHYWVIDVKYNQDQR
jgi:transcription elongation factor GreB